MSETWARKYRPLKYKDVIGQKKIVQLLQSRIKNGTAFDVNYIFAGGWGRGKTTLARIHARAMLCQQLNPKDLEPCNVCDNCLGVLNDDSEAFTEYDAASRGGVDNIRELIEGLVFSLASAPKRIYAFDEAQRMGHAAQDALLKPLEEHMFTGMFMTTELDKIRGAIRSRCEEHSILPVTRQDVLGRMEEILRIEGVRYTKEAVEVAVDHADQHVRDVYNNLQMLSQLGEITLDSVRHYLKLGHISKFYDVLLQLDNPSKVIPLVEELCDSMSARDVASGIADAAMVSFKAGIKIDTNLAYLDKDKAAAVFAKYKGAAVKFARWFTQPNRGQSTTALIGDIALFAANGGVVPDSDQPPIVFSSTQSNPSILEDYPVSAKKSVLHNMSSNEIDAIAIEKQKPRQRERNNQKEPISLGTRPHNRPDVLNPKDWKDKFDEMLSKRKIDTTNSE